MSIYICKKFYSLLFFITLKYFNLNYISFAIKKISNKDKTEFKIDKFFK